MQPASMPRSPQCENVISNTAVCRSRSTVANTTRPGTRPRAAAMTGLEWVIRPGVDAPQPRTTTSLNATRGSSMAVSGCSRVGFLRRSSARFPHGRQNRQRAAGMGGDVRARVHSLHSPASSPALSRGVLSHVLCTVVDPASCRQRGGLYRWRCSEACSPRS
ncbi:hypothetical protein L227DRAFT_159490 [Lentinus tigrinus ALCF2SS1-6]|uniref:Uncharacterized protein n=1 Tax=Lentinus tigrinus ALCF2SS1-6 TaxID=1328759 RepID=A0A5C2S7V3_9APHY|nr:hypothetical protein L227DRAFT_159490 [Lentinus tigrinus ALCF2SS1-6]